MSPLPNPKLWTPPTVGFLQTQDCFTNGGWWHDAHILEATGQGIDKEEARAWEGWWNEQIVFKVMERSRGPPLIQERQIWCSSACAKRMP